MEGTDSIGPGTMVGSFIRVGSAETNTERAEGSVAGMHGDRLRRDGLSCNVLCGRRRTSCMIGLHDWKDSVMAVTTSERQTV